MDLRIPGYQVVRPIAEGGMASVYLAIQESLEREVALKLLRQFDNPVQSSRFRNEGRIIASLNHRNIITIHDIGSVGERHYISMEFLEDGDLEKRIGAGMTPEAALDVVEIIGNCLDFLHHRGIIHRDIKPANILFRKDGTPVLTDFGIAKQLDRDIRLTLDSTALGSPCYLSPEQAECKPLDGRADIYGLGIILYEMLAGEKPFQGNSPIETILAHLTAPCPALPAELERYQSLLDRMIARTPDARYASAGEMVEAIRALRGQKPQRLPATIAAGVIREFSDAGIPAQAARHLAARAGRLLAAIRLRARPSRASVRVRSMWRKLDQIVPQDARLRRASAIMIVALLLAIAMGGFVTKPAGMARKEQTALASAAEPAAPPVVLQLNDDLAVQHEHLLRLARQALDDYRLTSPDNDNAYDYYRRVLEDDPDNAEALTGVARIADSYADLTEREIDQFHYRKARTYLERGLAVDPDNERLTKLKETSALSDAPRRVMDRVKSLFQ
jgi:tRNA A-37 threonylcarbamoyl transferase component Bud32/tetratricopeptide (TPR) repeat protein